MANSSAIRVFGNGAAASTPTSDTKAVHATGNELETALHLLESESAAFAKSVIVDPAARADYTRRTQAAISELLDMVKQRKITPHEAAQAANAIVVDTGNSTIRMIKPGGEVSTLAGQAGQCGFDNGSPTVSRLCAPAGIAVEGNDLYITDSDNATIRRINLDNVTSTVAGVAGQQGIVLGALPGGLDHPIGITLAPDGSLALTTHNLVVKLLVAK